MVAKARVKKDRKGKRLKNSVRRELKPRIEQKIDEDLPTYEDEVDDDYQYEGYSFIQSSKSLEETDKPIKRKMQPETDEDEQLAVKRIKKENEKKELKFLLPVKSDSGVQMRYQEIVKTEEDVIDSKQKVDKKNPKSKGNAVEEEQFKKFKGDMDWKTRIAGLAMDVLEDPENNLRRVRELLSGLSEPDLELPVLKAITASLVEIFKDILPSYRIHIATGTEKTQKVKKETLTLRHQEEAMLSIYQKFLQCLEKLVMVVHSRQEQTLDELSKAKMAAVGMSELMVNHINFNFQRNLIYSMVNVGTSRFKDFQEITAKTLKSIFRFDRAGDATYDAVHCISVVSKDRPHKLNAALLDTLLEVRLSKDLLEEGHKSAKKDRKQMSKSERKRQKEIAKVEKELQATQVEENRKVMAKLQSQTLQALFSIFFRIMRRAEDKVRLRLLPSILAGVARFAHLINVELVDGLVASISQIARSPECGVIEKLLCVKTVFVIVTEEGTGLNVDPHKFYEYILEVVAGMKGTEDRRVFVELVHCIDKGFIARKRLISAERAARCAVGLAGLVMRCNGKEAQALALLLRQLFLAHPTLDRLLDVEFVIGPIATLTQDDPLTPDTLWHLHCLLKHHDRNVRQIVERILGKGKNTASVMKESPSELLSQENEEFFC